MIYENLFLEDMFPLLPDVGKKTRLSVYMQDVTPEIEDGRKNPCVVICPGGGYSFTSKREAEPLALRFLGAGINAVIVWYACAPDAHYPSQLLQASAAIAAVRRNANEWHCDTERIAIMGFSAGGHLAGSVGVFWHEDMVREALGIKYGENKPNGMILAYPVLTSGQETHGGSISNLLGDQISDKALFDKMSIETQVTPHTPKAFLWHTVNDGAVPVENTLMMAAALQKQGISYEMHVYPSGVHGLSLCDETTSAPNNKDLMNPYVATWFEHCTSWIKKYL